MSFKSGLTKMAIKLTPNKLVLWTANIIIKDVAKLTDYRFDIEARTAYVEIQLVGESETIAVELDGFGIFTHEDSYKFIIQDAQSNRLWLDKILSYINGKAWTIPDTSHTEFFAELLKSESPEQEDI
ncbi:MAG: hypothetical protein DRQ62_01745 [Gammaproteobacteria bacterium]|nr:MAG: hypothetical protein DRQ62_01745 [Gammaproteobacteria bacterium]